MGPLVSVIDGSDVRRTWVLVKVRIMALDGQAAELVYFVFAGGSGETVAYFSGNDTPAILLVFFDGMTEALELWENTNQYVVCVFKNRTSTHLVFRPTHCFGLQLCTVSHLQCT